MINFTINGTLSGLNELIAANRKYWATGNKLKRRNMDIVKTAIYESGLNGCKCREPVEIYFYWYEKNQKRVIVCFGAWELIQGQMQKYVCLG